MTIERVFRQAINVGRNSTRTTETLTVVAPVRENVFVTGHRRMVASAVAKLTARISVRDCNRSRQLSDNMHD